MSLAMKARQRVKRKGATKDRVFGCDLVEHLQLSGQDVPQVLKSCTEFVEHHGVVDGIYRLSGVSSNIQRLRLEFDTDRTPDLNKDVYLQDIHCVSSLCKAYFRELPNPLLTYQLYDKFAEAVGIPMEEGRLEKIKDVLKELPAPHYRTLEFLMKHLVHMASFCSQTNMHMRNLAIVWAPNLLRSKEIESSGFNGTAAFMEVRIQSIVVEFILTHVEQIFGDAPLPAGNRESLRKSLLLMGPSIPLPDDKYSFSYNVPTMLNQGDGPPQMRPYHTIIELTDSKRKGSLKGKKWKSIFNLGRYSHDSKRKLNKPEDKEDKMAKMRLRPAKSMDSLSSMPCASNNDAQFSRNQSQKPLTLCRESFEGPASLDPSFLELAKCPEKGKDLQDGGSEGEATAKSEPTTPKSSRSSLAGPSPPGRSPKVSHNRAEKCAGVHISGPFLVTVPFHITSNLTLSRLTRGQECPALSHCALEKEMDDSSVGKEEEEEKEKYKETSTKEAEEKVTITATRNKEEPTGADRKVESLNDSEFNRMSMAVQDSFSFLDSQDAWLGDNLQEEQPTQSSSVAPDFGGSDLDDSLTMEDDVGSMFMNEMIGTEMQSDMFFSLPPLDYLSIEECMDEHLEEEEQYYLAMDYIHGEGLAREGDSEEVYLSAFDDLNPSAKEHEPLRPEEQLRDPDRNPPEGVLENQPFSLLDRIPLEGQTGSHLSEAVAETQSNDPPDHHLGLTDFSLDPERESDPSEKTKVGPRSNSISLETPLRDEAETTQRELDVGSPLQVAAMSGQNGDDLFLRTEDLVETKPTSGFLGKDLQSLPAVAFVDQGTQPSLEDEWNWELEGHKVFQDGHLQRPPNMTKVETGGSVPSGVSEKHRLTSQGTEHLPGGEASVCSQTARPPPSMEDPSSRDGHLSSSMGDVSENASSPRSSSLTPAFENLEQVASSREGFPVASFSDRCVELDVCSEISRTEGPLQNPQHEPPGEVLTASQHDFTDGSVPMKLTSSTIRVQNPQYEPPGEVLTVSQHDLTDGSITMKLTSSTVRVHQVRSFPVIPPKPQFAKIPAALKPKSPTKEVSTLCPNLSALAWHCGNGMKDGFGERSLHRSLRPSSLDTSWSNIEINKKMETFMSLSMLPNSLDNKDSSEHQKQRNSMPGSLEKYSRDGKGREGLVPKPLLSPLDEDGHSPKRSELIRDDFSHSQCPLLQSWETVNPKSEDGKGESFLKQIPVPISLEGHGTAPKKAKWNSWRHGGSMSFDEAVALAKERQAAQSPMRRMKTYCCGDVQAPPSPPRVEKTVPQPKLALKPLGESPTKPASCVGTMTASDAPASRKPFLIQALPKVSLESEFSLSEKALLSPQDHQPRQRISFERMGRHFSVSEEAPCSVPQERW